MELEGTTKVAFLEVCLLTTETGIIEEDVGQLKGGGLVEYLRHRYRRCLDGFKCQKDSINWYACILSEWHIPELTPTFNKGPQPYPGRRMCFPSRGPGPLAADLTRRDFQKA